LTGISRRKGHKNANFGPLKTSEALRFYATMAAICSNLKYGLWLYLLVYVTGTGASSSLVGMEMGVVFPVPIASTCC
jgi:hypothetical protein